MPRAYFWNVDPEEETLEVGEFSGSREVESLAPNATYDLPPGTSPGYAVTRVGSSWVVVENHRGLTIYSTTDGSELEITSLGPIPGGYTEDVWPGAFWTWSGSAWEFQLGDRKDAVSEVLMGLATQILALSDLIVHDWEEQGLSGNYVEAEYDAEVIKRVTLRGALTTKFSEIKAATNEGELDAIEATLNTLYRNQLESYAADLLSRAP